MSTAGGAVVAPANVPRARAVFSLTTLMAVKPECADFAPARAWLTAEPSPVAPCENSTTTTTLEFRSACATGLGRFGSSAILGLTGLTAGFEVGVTCAPVGVVVGRVIDGVAPVELEAERLWAKRSTPRPIAARTPAMAR